MITKRLAILANSVRSNNHCIAGKELNLRDNKWYWGDWVRPVSLHGEGEINNRECMCSNGMQTLILDTVEIAFSEKQQCDSQPENHLIDSSIKWKKTGKLPNSSLLDIIEEPDNLWLHRGTKTDRIHSDHAIESVVPFQSLYLIRPNNLHFKIWQAEDQYYDYPRKHRRAIFSYNNAHYNLSITDPTMESRYFRNFPPLNEPAVEIQPNEPNNCLLVVSLAKPFTDGYHYKIVATVLEVNQ